MVRLTDRPDMTLDVYRGRKTTKQQVIWFMKSVIIILVLWPLLKSKKRILNKAELYFIC